MLERVGLREFDKLHSNKSTPSNINVRYKCLENDTSYTSKQDSEVIATSYHNHDMIRYILLCHLLTIN